MQSGLIRKMKVSLNDVVDYSLRLDDKLVPINDFVGRSFGLKFTGEYACIKCGREVKKLYGQGFCYPCFRDAPENSPCIIRPELCEAHLGIGRDVAWEKENHDQPHVVYASFTGAVKVGVTRATQVPTRWIDQGATMAVVLAVVPHRQLAGVIEVDLKKEFSDKTNWRNMIKGVDADESVLKEAKQKAGQVLDPEFKQYLVNEDVRHIAYPGEINLPQIKSVKLDKVNEVQATLVGIRGQYLVWADGRVMNVRNHSGYRVELMQ